LVVVGAAVVAVPMVQVRAQSDAKPPAFEVVSVKPNDSGGPIRVSSHPGSYSATNISVSQLMMAAYHLQDFKISGGPSWIRSSRFNVEGRAESGSDATTKSFDLMLQRLLEDRFKLRAHVENRDLAVYELTVVPHGPKVKAIETPAEPVSILSAPVEAGRDMPPPGQLRVTIGDLMASQMPFEGFVRFLSNTVERPVIDRTGLRGVFDIKLRWSPAQGERGPFGPATAAAADAYPDRPSLFTAVQEQLGLKLERAKGPVDVLVIDSVAHPTEN